MGEVNKYMYNYSILANCRARTERNKNTRDKIDKNQSGNLQKLYRICCCSAKKCFIASSIPWGSSDKLGCDKWRYRNWYYNLFLKHEIDTGEIIDQVRVPIADTDNVEVVYERFDAFGR